MEFSAETTPTQVLLLGEIATTILVFLGVRAIRANAVHRHRSLMLWSLGLNVGLLASFLVVDVIRASNTVERGLTAPLYIFVPMLLIHLAIAIGAMTLAVWGWRVARTGVQRNDAQQVIGLEADIRARHRKISKYYPALWYSTLVTGLLLYGVLYIRF